MLDGAGIAVADHQISLMRQNRPHQLGDIFARILVIGVGVDNQIRAQPQTGVQAGGKAGGQSLIAIQAHDMVNAQLPRDLHRFILAAVVDHQNLDGIDALDLAGQVRQRDRQGLRFVITGNLNDQLHLIEDLLNVVLFDGIRMGENDNLT
ncbi:MAG: hypothetical protein BWY83_02694 [bacterium ADurb.Bin478]|nr:MAG: hypothetical protein BWY83_02694 [bacterium ADurb.Bin478]